MDKITVTIKYEGDGWPPLLTKEIIRGIKKMFPDNDLELVTNHGMEIHSREMKGGKFEDITITKTVNAWAEAGSILESIKK